MKVPLFFSYTVACAAVIVWLVGGFRMEGVLVTSDDPPGPTPQLTEEQAKAAREFGHNFADAISMGNIDQAEAVFDYEVLLDRALQGIRMTPAQLLKFRSSFLEGIRRREGGVLNSILGSHYRFLGVREVDGEPQMVFRYVSANGGFDYHRYQFRIDRFGRFIFTDFFPFMAGDVVSASLRRLALPVAETTRDGSTSEIDDEMSRAHMDHVDDLRSLAQKIATGEHEAARRIFEKLPELLRRDRQLVGTVIPVYASSKDEGDYLRLIEELAAANPEDPSMPLILIDYHLRKKEFDEARARISEIEEQVGEDSYLDLQRALVHLEEDKPAAAVVLMRSVVAAEGNIEQAWWTLMQAALEVDEHVMTASAIHRLKTGFGRRFSFDQMKSDATYEAFFSSPAGKALLESVAGEG